MKKRLYKVMQAILGAGRNETLFFKTKDEADEYVRNHDFCNYAGSACFSEKEYNAHLQETVFNLNY